MASSGDLWYVRLPDGRVMRARSTEAMRHFLKSGRIPLDCRVRRPAEESWQALDRVAEFADLMPAEPEPEPRGKGRSATVELRTLGVRGLIEELYNAFDSSLQKAKLTTAAITGLAIGVALVVGEVAILFLPTNMIWLGYLGAAFVLILLFSICTSILTKMTHLELSRFRPARFNEIRPGLFVTMVRVTCALGLVSGLILGLIVLLRSLPRWLAPADPGEVAFELQMLLNIVNGARLLLEVICWPILSLAMLLLGPILIVEEYSIWQALREWLGMLRQHLGRIYLYQAIAFGLTAVMTLPLLLPVMLAFGFVGKPFSLPLGESAPLSLLLGIAMTPMLAYLLVAHVFIYLNLRYEFYSARER